jgi:hypothetical protein
MPGQMIFLPVVWWYPARAFDFSVKISYANFRWRDDGYRDFPAP